MALAGPAVNLVLILVTAPLLLGGLAFDSLTGGEIDLPSLTDPGLLNFVTFLFMVNVSLLCSICCRRFRWTVVVSSAPCWP